ncbi:hypothetical protein ES703_71104 [subsurface metagenome]
MSRVAGVILSLIGGLISLFLGLFLIDLYPEFLIIGELFVLTFQICMILGGLISFAGVLLSYIHLNLAWIIIFIGSLLGGVNILTAIGAILIKNVAEKVKGNSIFIQSSKKDKKKISRKIPSIDLLINKMELSFIDRMVGTVHIESIKKINEEKDAEGYVLKLILNDESSSIKVIIEGVTDLNVLNSISEEDYVEFRNVYVRFNTETNEKELYFDQDSSFNIL